MKLKHTTPVAISLAVAATLHAQQPTPAERLKRPAVEELGSARLSEVVVNAEPERARYEAPKEAEVTMLPAPVKELPVTVNTISKEFIKDTSARRVRDVVGYIPGVNVFETGGSVGDILLIRGFESTTTTLNGLRKKTSGHAQTFGNIERFEIMKGPAGVEFGVVQPGGFLNFVTKKPQKQFSLTLGAEVGSYDYYGGIIDATGPLWIGGESGGFSKDGKSVASGLSKDGKTVAGGFVPGIYYRFIAAGENANSFRDGYDSDRVQIAPSLLYEYAEGSSVLLEIEYEHSNQPADRGVMYLEGAGLSGDFFDQNINWHDPRDYNDEHNSRVSLYWNHKLNDTFTLKLDGEMRYSHFISGGARNPQVYGDTFYIPGTYRWNGNRTVLRGDYDFADDTYSYTLQPSLLAKFTTGSVNHTALLGVSYQITMSDSPDVPGGTSSWSTDLFHPTYGTRGKKGPPGNPADPGSLPLDRFVDNSAEETEEFGVFYQHKIDIADRLHLIAGARLNWYEYDFADAFTYGTTAGDVTEYYPQNFSDQNLSWRAGAVYDLTKQLSLFLGYSNAFVPQSGVLAGGGSPDALESTSWEAGIKASFLEGRLQTTLSAYELTRKNILQGDPSDPTGRSVIPLGEARVRGLELETTGAITRDLDLALGFTLMDSETIETDDVLAKGREFYGVPNIQGSLRLRYDTSRWLIPGLSVGAGVIYVGDRAGDNHNRFTLPDYWRYDLGLYYQYKNWNFKVTCENVADERYYTGSQNRPQNVIPGAPRLIAFGAEVKF
jgi:iron complex outermembrane recepter protein